MAKSAYKNKKNREHRLERRWKKATTANRCNSLFARGEFNWK